MANLVGRLRRMVDDAPLDAGAVRVWTDDELQQFLDEHRIVFRHEILYPQVYSTYVSIQTAKVYHSRYENLEELTTDDANVFRLYDAFSSDATGFTADYVTGAFTFDAEQLGKYYYLDGRDYDLNGAAAQCWAETAGRTAKKYSLSHASGNSFSRSDWFEHCLKMAEGHKKCARMKQVRAVR